MRVFVLNAYDALQVYLIPKPYSFMMVVVVVAYMRKEIANFYSTIAARVSRRSVSLANKIQAKADQIAANQNAKKMVVLGENDFYIKYVNADNHENIAWDDFYASGALFFKGFSNPVQIERTENPQHSELVKVKPCYRKAKVRADNNEFDLIPSSRYRQYMKQHALRDAFSYNIQDGLTIEQWQMITVGAVLFLALVVAGVSL